MPIPDLRLGFSISATSRAPRGCEMDGKEYFFLSPDDFKKHVEQGDFVEWEEVYAGTCYGTLRSEVERVTGSGRNLIMDIDVKGALNVKKQFGEDAISVFILPPSVEELEKRLRSRNTDSEESLRKRIDKAQTELSYADKFDCRVVNDDLDEAVDKTVRLIRQFIEP